MMIYVVLNDKMDSRVFPCLIHMKYWVCMAKNLFRGHFVSTDDSWSLKVYVKLNLFLHTIICCDAKQVRYCFNKTQNFKSTRNKYESTRKKRIPL